MSISARYAQVTDRMRRAAERAGRAASDVTLVAVSKTFGVDSIIEANKAGITDFGENRAQELRSKAEVIGDRVRWHFVGPLQRNKVRYVVGVAKLIHSVDRLDLGEALARRARSLGAPQQVLVEVNVSGEAQKHGVEPQRAADLAMALDALDGLDVVGLMTMPPLPRDPEDSRPHYKELAALSEVIRRGLPRAMELSMGMTGDFEVGIEEGATMVRIGEAIFGPRPRAREVSAPFA